LPDGAVTHRTLRQVLIVIWAAVAAATIFIFLFHRDLIDEVLQDTAGTSLVAAATLYVIFACLRGFTLIPLTSLVLVGIVVFPPGLLFGLTLAGIVVTSLLIYYFSGALHIEEILKSKHARVLDRVRTLLDRHGFLIIVAWSFFPLTPTDLICYLSGVARINIWVYLAGVIVGKGGICAVYIYFGDVLLRGLGLR
jgi:uncharacterized membrane protein YdjX (TVP38/TMEM64 family)